MVKHISETSAPIPNPDVIDEVGSASSIGIKSNIALPPFARDSQKDSKFIVDTKLHLVL